jgi:hypothetical protein
MPKLKASVIFIHGLAKKPPHEKLIELWLEGLGTGNPRPDVFPAPNEGINFYNEGVPHFLNYYADVFYGTDYDTDYTSYYESNGYEGADEIAKRNLVQDGLAISEELTPREQKFLIDLEAKLGAAMEASAALTAVESAAVPTEATNEGFELAGWVPAPIREAIIKKAAMEAYYFLFNKEFERADGQRFHVRKELRTRLLNEIGKAAEKADKVILVSHSMGTMIAYDVLRNCPDCPPVDTLITLGSPLGIREVQAELVATGEKSVDFPAAKLGSWINIYDPLDPICGADPRFANDYRSVNGKSVQDVKESNWGKWRHTITHYLAGTLLRGHLRKALEIRP